jgi:hypothetical protein
MSQKQKIQEQYEKIIKEDLDKVMWDKVEYIKLSNKGNFIKAEIKTKDGTFMNFSSHGTGAKINSLVKEIQKRIKEY